MDAAIEPATETAPETATVSVGGQPVEYEPLSSEALDSLFQRLTPKQRLALHYAAKGYLPAQVVAEAGIALGTLVAWRKQIPGYRSAYYGLLDGAATLGTEAVRAAAKGDALLHYEAINELAAMEPGSAADRTVKLAANKETLTLAGAYLGTTQAQISFGDVLVQIANMGNAPLGGLPPPDATDAVALEPREEREAAMEAPVAEA